MPKDTKSKEAKASKRTATKEKKTAAPTDGKKRRTRTKKDPSAPKRGLSAYMFFSQEHRKLVQGEHPDASFGEIGKILGDKWKHMSERDKKPYVEKAEIDKKRYESEKAAVASGAKAANDDDEEEDEDEDDDE
jgi:hypothetical protein